MPRRDDVVMPVSPAACSSGSNVCASLAGRGKFFLAKTWKTVRSGCSPVMPGKANQRAQRFK